MTFKKTIRIVGYFFILYKKYDYKTTKLILNVVLHQEITATSNKRNGNKFSQMEISFTNLPQHFEALLVLNHQRKMVFSLFHSLFREGISI